MIDVPETHRQRAERGRLVMQGRHTDDGAWCALTVVHETDGAWTIHGLGATGVRLSAVDMVELVTAILERS